MLPPDAQRVLSYAMPGWRIPVRGQAQTSTATPPATKVAAGIAAFKNHLGFYPHSGSIIPKLAADLNAEGFKTSKSGILFTPEHPIPDWALKEALRLRVEQIG